jgi:hypothetical protein
VQHDKATLSLYGLEEGRAVRETFGEFIDRADEKMKWYRLPHDHRSKH